MLSTSCPDRRLARPAARALLPLLFALLLGAAFSLHAPAARAADVAAPVQAPQDPSLGSLGIADQTVRGAAGSVLAYFPAPAAPLASSGNFVRIFFAHSEPDDRTARVVVAVNGRVLDSVPLGAGTRAGGVFEKAVPAGVLHEDQPNLLEVRFSLLAPGAPAGADVHGVVGSRSQLHYELRAADGGRPDALEDYPAGFLATASTAGGKLPVALALPASPDAAEVGSLARLMADLGRRVRVARVAPEVVSGDPARWLPFTSAPAIMLGRLDQLPVAGALLQRAGFTPGAEGWRPPRAAAAVSPDSGLLAVVPAPGGQGQPVLLVTGGSDLALSRAAEALIGGQDGRLKGRYAVVDGDSESADDSLLGSDPLRLSTLLGQDASPQGSGEHRLLFQLPSRAAEAGSSGQLHLQFDAGQASEDAGTPAVELNGHALQVSSSRSGGRSSLSVDVGAPARYLHPGLNLVTVLLRLAGGSGPTLSAAQSTFAAAPPPQRRAAGVASLPYPFLDGGQGATTALVLAGLDGSTLQTVAAGFAAMGSRAIAPPPPASVRVLLKAETVVVPSQSLVLVGSPPWARQLRLRQDGGGELTLRPPTSNSGLGWVLRQGPLLAGLQLLWFGGSDGGTSAAAALAPGGPSVDGDLLSVDPQGRATGSAVSSPTTIRSAWETWLPRLLPVAAGLLLLLVVLGSQTFSGGPGKEALGRPSRAAVVVVLTWCLLATMAQVMVSWGPGAVLLPLAVLAVGALSLRGPAWQGVVTAILAAAVLESVDLFLAGSGVLVTLGAGPLAAPDRLTAGTGLSQLMATLFGMALILATPGVAALAQRSRRAAAARGERGVLARKSLF